jgi:negative regulator of flagellin synthesis FlgM
VEITDRTSSLQQVISSSAPSRMTFAAQGDDTHGRVAKDIGVSTANVATDHASLSAAGSLAARALEASDTRADRITVVQEAIALGSYHVSSSDLTDKIIQTLLNQDSVYNPSTKS